MRAVRKKKKLWKKVRNGVITDEYRQVQKVKNIIQRAKRNFEKRFAAGSNGSKGPFYAYVKQRTKSRPAVGPLKAKDGKRVTDTVEM